MQLILEAENANIDIKEKMSLMLEQESLSEKLISNGNCISDSEVLDAASSKLPTANADTNHIKNNILDTSADHVTAPVLDKKIEESKPSSLCTTDNALSKANIDSKTLPVAVTPVEENSSNIDIIAPQLCSNVDNVNSNGKNNEESQSDISENKNSEVIKLPAEVDASIEEKMEICETLENIVVAGKDNKEKNSAVREKMQSDSIATVGDNFEMEVESEIVKDLDNEPSNSMNLNERGDNLKQENTLETNVIFNITKLNNEPKSNIPSDEGNTENEKSNNQANDDQKKRTEFTREEVCQPLKISTDDENQLLNANSETDRNYSVDNAMECDNEFNVVAQSKNNTVPPNEDLLEIAPSITENNFESRTKDHTVPPKEDSDEIAATTTDNISESHTTGDTVPTNVDLIEIVATGTENISESHTTGDTVPTKEDLIETATTGTENISGCHTTDSAVPPKEDLVDKVPNTTEVISDSLQDEVTDIAVSENKNVTDISMDCDEIATDDTKIDETIRLGNEEVPGIEQRDVIQADVSDEVIKINAAVNADQTDVLSDKPDETVVASEVKDGVPIDNETDSEEISQKNVIRNMKPESVEEIFDVDEIESKSKNVPEATEPKIEKEIIQTIKLSNTLDILSDDDEDEEPIKVNDSQVQDNKGLKDTEKQYINLDDDDDVMLIDEDLTTKEDKIETSKSVSKADKVNDKTKSDPDTVTLEDDPTNIGLCKESADNEKETATPATTFTNLPKPEINEKNTENEFQKEVKTKPLLPENFLKLYKKNLTDMTRDDLEEFCILKIVESIIDRSNLTEIRTKLKSMTQSIDEYKKKAMMLTKQNRDLQVVLKSVQEEQKKCGNAPITPLKITRSVGMQVLMTDKNRRKVTPVGSPGPITNTRPVRSTVNQNARQQSLANSQPIPVPRLVPAAASNTSVMKPPSVPQVNCPKNQGKGVNVIPNGIRSSPPAQKAEKRPHNKMLTVDLTDDEPPSKVVTRNTAPPVRLVSPQNLMAPRPPQAQTGNNPRKVFIPISGPPGQNVRGGTVMLRNVTPPGPRPRGQIPMVRIPQNAVRMGRAQGGRHPAPLPDAMKQYQPPNWKALPPAPDLKLSKVENGIVISWKIEGYQEDSYEEIASYQLYAYQETTSPPNTSLWKKIGDVKALPLPMACTLTQFMAGYKYYFAVRAVDVRSRLGPFSLPGSILLLNKV